MTQQNIDGLPAWRVGRLPSASNGDSFVAPLSTVDIVQLTMRDATITSGTAKLSYSLSGTTITLAIAGYSAGTVDVLCFGRL